MSLRVVPDGEEKTNETFDQLNERNIQELARSFTRGSLSSKSSKTSSRKRNENSSSSNDEPENPFDTDDPKLNPDSDLFNAKYWIQNLNSLQELDTGYYKPYKMGVVYKNLRCFGRVADADYQEDFFNWVEKVTKIAFDTIKPSKKVKDILSPMDALIKPGSLVVVLGRPGAGCSTLLKTISAQTYGFDVDNETLITYNGLSPKDINKNYRGEIIYNAETEIHFPNLTVGQTLKFASLLKVPQNRLQGITRDDYAEHFAKVYMSIFGLSHTYFTKVGNDFIRGVSGGERKRVSIAEVCVCGAKLQCWDNSTRGLDSASAENFVKCLKLSSDILDITSIVSIYQCSQSTYELFDQVILLYEGRQIFFGNTNSAKQFFENMGWQCPPRQTTADFLTSLTSPSERTPKKGWESNIPQTAEEFETYWKNSPQYEKLVKDIEEYLQHVETEKDNFKNEIYNSKVARQAHHSNHKEPYTVSYNMQVRYLTIRAFQRIRNDLTLPAFTIFANFFMAIINSSIFFNLQNVSSDIYYRGACLFFSCLFNSLMSLLEVFALYESRPIVEKHKLYGLYHPSAEAFASIISEIPTKFLTSIAFNITLYFMVNFKREPGPFFFYLLIATSSTFAMSHLFRSIGSVTKTLSQAMTPSAVLVLAMALYAGFVMPVDYMLGWSRWINYINPIAYVFESMMINEFQGRIIECTTMIPREGLYDEMPLTCKVCDTVGSVSGETFVSGDRYLNVAFKFTNAHKWRNWGIIMGFVFFLLGTYLLFVEFNSSSRQTGEKVIFLRSSLMKKEKEQKNKNHDDVENQTMSNSSNDLILGDNSGDGTVTDEGINLDSGHDIFHWTNVCFDIPYKGGSRRLLTEVDGFVKPGTLTALMGSSGAGKTTLLDVLADRITMGVVTGDMLVNGRPRGSSFQRSTGYVEQQDLHLKTSTVREALRFSAYLRQSGSISRKAKEDYVENIIDVLEMRDYADAIVGIPGEGLNVEQRKRLTIGVELCAKPKLLLFLDEPTSGLDSQTAWSILRLIRKLSNSGQAIMCTIHQPSAMLFSQFDNLLLLRPGGETVYYGPLGDNAVTLIDYLERNGATKCPTNDNPADWMLKVITETELNWFDLWRNSPEYQKVKTDLESMKTDLLSKPSLKVENEKSSYASTIGTQYTEVTKRVFQQYWRSPWYIYSKILLAVLTSLLNGFSFFKTTTTIQGLQNQMFSIFMYTADFPIFVEQMLPHFVSQRELYEARERPSRTFSWFVFITAQITVEIPWMIFAGTLSFLCFYLPVDFAHNAEATGTVHGRGTLIWLLCVQFYLFTFTLGQASIAGIQVEQNAANLGTLLFSLSLLFCGVLVTKVALPGFWIFMYRVSPFTYWIPAFLSAGLGNSAVTCADHELLEFEPFAGYTCGQYMEDFMEAVGGYLVDPTSTKTCEYCKMANTDVYLNSIDALYFSDWQNFGIFWVYIVVNIIATIFLYWLFRVPKKNDPISKLKSLIYPYFKKYNKHRKERKQKFKNFLHEHHKFQDSGLVTSWLERKRKWEDISQGI